MVMVRVGDKTRQNHTRPHKTIQDKQDKTRQDKTRPGLAKKWNETRHSTEVQSEEKKPITKGPMKLQKNARKKKRFLRSQ